MQITLCSIDMCRIVKGLYLLSKKFFIICTKKLVQKAISLGNTPPPELNKLTRTTAVQDFNQIKKEIFLEQGKKVLNKTGLKKKH